MTANTAASWACIVTLVTTVCGLTLDTVSNPSFNANGAAAKLKALAKFAHLADPDSTIRYTATGGKPSPEQAYKQFIDSRADPRVPGNNISGFAEANDREWLCPVQIGTPAQTVYLDLDTGSGDL